jgi:nitrous oxidase accessory protein
VADNEVSGLSALPFGRRGDGVYCYRAPDTLVARNRITGERDAIYFQYAPRGRAIDNIVSGARYGLHDMFSDDATVSGNSFVECAVGANVMNSRRIAVERNRFEASRGIPGVGLTLKDCDDSRVAGNRIAGNPRGLLLDGASANRFEGNVFTANDTAVTLFSSAERNQFGGNAFRDNWSDLVVNGRDSGTAWTIDGRGNYWSRYRGFDFDGDGIGDSAHGALGAFERVEGLNPAARIFLHSPAAAGLEIAARLSALRSDDAVDPRPLVAALPDPMSERTTRRTPAWIVLAAAGIAVVVTREAARAHAA